MTSRWIGSIVDGMKEYVLVLYLAGCFNVLLTSHEHQNITGRESKMDGKHLILIGNDEKRKG